MLPSQAILVTRAAPVLSASNDAEGLLVAFQANPPPAAGLINVIRLRPMLQRASKALDRRLTVD